MTSDPNCVISEDNEVCTRCAQNFAINPDLKCQKSVENCLYAGESESTCAVCLEGTFLTDQKKCEGNPIPLPIPESHAWKWAIAMVIVVIGLLIIYYAFARAKKREEEVKEPARAILIEQVLND